MIKYLAAHPDLWPIIGGVAWWLFSSLMNAMPALPANAPWFVIWMHNFFQYLAANGSKVISQYSKQTLITPDKIEQTESGPTPAPTPASQPLAAAPAPAPSILGLQQNAGPQTSPAPASAAIGNKPAPVPVK